MTLFKVVFTLFFATVALATPLAGPGLGFDKRRTS